MSIQVGNPYELQGPSSSVLDTSTNMILTNEIEIFPGHDPTLGVSVTGPVWLTEEIVGNVAGLACGEVPPYSVGHGAA